MQPTLNQHRHMATPTSILPPSHHKRLAHGQIQQNLNYIWKCSSPITSLNGDASPMVAQHPPTHVNIRSMIGPSVAIVQQSNFLVRKLLEP